MSKISFYTVFCEDVRYETSGSPILIGIMSPTFNASDYPINFHKLSIVTFFKADTSVEEFEAELTVNKIENGEKEEIGSFDATYEMAELWKEGRQWVSVSTLPMNDIEFYEGTEIEAIVKVKDVVDTTFLTAGSKIAT